MKTPTEIVHEVSAETGVRVSAIMSRSKVRPVVKARWLAMWRIYNELDWSLVAIGGFFERDHSTVWWGIEGHNDVLAAQKAAS